jgi:hypothetical protein
MRVRPVPLLVAIFGIAALTSVLVARESLRHRSPPAPAPAAADAVASPPAVATVEAPVRAAPPSARPRGAGAVEGRIVDDAGRSLAGVHVRAIPRAPPAPAAAPAEARTDFDGRFRLESVPAGRAEIVAQQDGVLAGAARTVDVTERGTAQVAIALPEAGVLSGRVRAAGRRPPPGTTVQAAALNAGGGIRQVAHGALDDAGGFRLALPAGEYRVHAEPPTGAVPARFVAQPSFARVDPGRTTALELALAPAAAWVEILVLEPGGEPSAGAVVTLARPDDRRIAFATSTGPDGRAAVAPDGIAGRTVTLRARNDERTATETLALPAAGTITVRLAPAPAVPPSAAGGGARR